MQNPWFYAVPLCNLIILLNYLIACISIIDEFGLWFIYIRFVWIDMLYTYILYVEWHALWGLKICIFFYH